MEGLTYASSFSLLTRFHLPRSNNPLKFFIETGDWRVADCSYGTFSFPSCVRQCTNWFIMLPSVSSRRLGTARHYRIPLWFGLLFPASRTAVVILAWSSLVLRRTGHVKWKDRTCGVVGKGGPGPW